VGFAPSFPQGENPPIKRRGPPGPQIHQKFPNKKKTLINLNKKNKKCSLYKINQNIKKIKKLSKKKFNNIKISLYKK